MSNPRCKGCGREIIWVEHKNPVTQEIKKVPLDPRAPTYRRNEAGQWIRSDAYVSHFSTCSQANQFSNSSKSAPPDDPWWNRD